MALTAEGERVIGHARDLVAANDCLLAALKEPVFSGEVRFGAPYDIMGSYTPGILRRFSAALPNIRVTLVCEDTIVLLEQIRAGTLDVALTTELGCGKGGETLRSDRLVWTGARNGSAYTKDPVPVSLGAGTCVFRPVAVAALKKAKRAWQPVCEVSNMEPVRATLESDLAVAPLLSHSVPASLEIVNAGRRLPRLPLFRINLYQAPAPSDVANAFAGHVRRSVASS